VITPSRQLFAGYETETSNRIIKRYVNECGLSPEAFVRVQVCDEDERRLFGNDLSDSLLARLEKALLCLNICGKQYHFFLYSASQLKEGSVWMYSAEPGYSLGRIRSSMGDFSSCKTIPKLAARGGQCFSSTIDGLRNDTSNQDSEYRPVVTGELESSTIGSPHSDGTGLIRREVMDEIVQRLPWSVEPEDVSIIQIRYGGAKGTLTAWDATGVGSELLPSDIKKSKVCLRPSMIKFEAPYANLEVCSIGKHIPYFTNRHVVLLLSARGVSWRPISRWNS